MHTVDFTAGRNFGEARQVQPILPMHIAYGRQPCSSNIDHPENDMRSQLLVVGLGRSLSKHSNSLAAVKVALEGAAETGARTELLVIRELALPMYDPENTNAPASVTKLCEAIHRADGLIWSSPMYHGTISGSFKYALDWLQLLGDRKPPYLTDKVAGLISTAGGVQRRHVNTMEFVVRALRGWAVPLVMPIAQEWKAFDENGKPVDTQLTEQLNALGREVARGSCQFELEPPTRADAAKAEAQVTPASDREAKSESPSTARNVFGKRFAGRRPVRLRTPRTGPPQSWPGRRGGEIGPINCGGSILHSGPNDPCVVPVLRALDLELCSVWR